MKELQPETKKRNPPAKQVANLNDIELGLKIVNDWD
jgi:hypothetical protein